MVGALPRSGCRVVWALRLWRLRQHAPQPGRSARQRAPEGCSVGGLVEGQGAMQQQALRQLEQRACGPRRGGGGGSAERMQRCAGVTPPNTAAPVPGPPGGVPASRCRLAAAAGCPPQPLIARAAGGEAADRRRVDLIGWMGLPAQRADGARAPPPPLTPRRHLRPCNQCARCIGSRPTVGVQRATLRARNGFSSFARAPARSFLARQPPPPALDTTRSDAPCAGSGDLLVHGCEPGPGRRPDGSAQLQTTAVPGQQVNQRRSESRLCRAARGWRGTAQLPVTAGCALPLAPPRAGSSQGHHASNWSNADRCSVPPALRRL